MVVLIPGGGGDVVGKPTPGSITIISVTTPNTSFFGFTGSSGFGSFGKSTENATILISLESLALLTASANAALDFWFVTEALRNCL